MSKALRFNPHLRLQAHHKVLAVAGRHLQNITAVFRAVEILLFLAVVSRCSLMLPLALQLSGGYFRDFALTAVSPRFVFVLGNAIVIILFVKSGGRLPQPKHVPETSAAAEPVPETTTYIVSVHSSARAKSAGGGKSEAAAEVKINCYRRSKSEKISVKREEKRPVEKVLRRTKTTTEKVVVKERFPEDKMSSDEFRRTIEDFIARQQRFLREEDEEEDESRVLATVAR